MSTIRFGRDERERDPLLREIGTLPREVAPPHDLWAGIRAQIEREEQAQANAVPASPPLRAPGLSLSWGWALAAGVGVAAVSVLFTWLAVRTPAEAPPQVAAQQPSLQPTPVEAIRPVAYGEYARLGPEYVELRARMLEQFKSRLAGLSDGTRLRIEQDLAAIQKAADDIDAALAEDPASRLLNQLLLSTYQEELRLYSSVAAEEPESAGQRT
jgi:hypothetical protein